MFNQARNLHAFGRGTIWRYLGLGHLRLGRFNLATVRFGDSSKLARFIKYVLLRYPTGDQFL